MAEYSHLMVTTDFSDESARAAARAARIAADSGARLSVVHIVDYIPPPYAAAEIPAEYSSPETLMEAARDHLASWVAEQGISCDNQWAEPGSPKSEIGRVAKEHGVDLIVIGTHGLSGLKHLLLGSIAERVVQKAPCPVLTVKPCTTHASD